jgi:hypothetical protein
MKKQGPATSDPYRRREVRAGLYQCGCRWKRSSRQGDVLVECPIHAEATRAKVRNFERLLRRVHALFSTP